MAPRPRILVIDDDPLFLKLTARLLSEFYAVRTADSGSQGFHLAQERLPHVALIDVQMAGWSGLETLEKFHQHPELTKVKTAILTGDASPRTVVSAIQNGADEYIVKTNFTKEELLQKVKVLVSQSPLPIEDEADNPADDTSRPPKSAGVSNVAAANPAGGSEVAAANPAGGSDARLQELIDDWE